MMKKRDEGGFFGEWKGILLVRLIREWFLLLLLRGYYEVCTIVFSPTRGVVDVYFFIFFHTFHGWIWKLACGCIYCTCIRVCVCVCVCVYVCVYGVMLFRPRWFDVVCIVSSCSVVSCRGDDWSWCTAVGWLFLAILFTLLSRLYCSYNLPQTDHGTQLYLCGPSSPAMCNIWIF